MVSEPTYLAARIVAPKIAEHFARHLQSMQGSAHQSLASVPYFSHIENVIDAAFWASLRREEGHSPTISLALLQPGQCEQPLLFGNKIRLTPDNLIKLAPAVAQPGIHLGVWPEEDSLYIWGTTHHVPGLCFVLEVIEPGLLVVKHRRVDGFGKFANVAVLQGDQVKILDEVVMGIADCPALEASLKRMPLPSYMGESFNLLVQLATSMRLHGRGGLVLMVPEGSAQWQSSIIQPVKYPILPSYNAIAGLIAKGTATTAANELEWQEALLQSIDLIGGFTAVDGATVITQTYDLLAFGAKVTRSVNSLPVEEMIITEPVVNGKAAKIHPAQHGGTRHLAAAQFVHDQPDAVALVASQDGQFTVFAWSVALKMVHAHRIDALLL